MSTSQGLAKWEETLARIKARTFAAKYKLTLVDTEDLEQELLVHLYKQRQNKAFWESIDVSEQTMVEKILENKGVDFVRGRHTKRESFITQAKSLSAPEPEESDEDSARAVMEPSYVEELERTSHEDAAMKEGVARALGKLTQVQKNIARLIMEGKKTSEITRILGLHRTTVERGKKAIGKHIRRGRLDQFM